jgi:tetratricopeptide (TPR) repeat protein
MESGDYNDAQKAYQDAQTAYDDIYSRAGIHSGLMVPGILSTKLKQVEKYIMASFYINRGETYEIYEMYEAALDQYKEAEFMAKTTGDLKLIQHVMELIVEANRKMISNLDGPVRTIRTLMHNAEDNLNYDLALQYADFIIDMYKDLKIVDAQSEDDRKNIEQKIEWDMEAEAYISSAKRAIEFSRYADAVRDYQTVLELYGKMKIDTWHEKCTTIRDEIIRISMIIEGVKDDDQQVDQQFA